MAEPGPVGIAAGFCVEHLFHPEGSYVVPDKVRHILVADGFEVGVHDLKHDGKLLFSRSLFSANARRINHYLKEWDAPVSGPALCCTILIGSRNWISNTMPRPSIRTLSNRKPEGMDTIFPFWVAGAGDRGYVELPYTLAQDSTLFLVLGEKDNRLWKEKFDWVAAHGGMVLMNTHPDYMAFDGAAPGEQEFPAAYYEDVLRYAQTKYAGCFWHALPKEVSRYVAGHVATASPLGEPCGQASEASPQDEMTAGMAAPPQVRFLVPKHTREKPGGPGGQAQPASGTALRPSKDLDRPGQTRPMCLSSSPSSRN